MKTKKLVISSMLIAVASVLSIFQPFQLPFGGGITIASMMPIILLAFCYGTRWGFFSAFIFSLIQLLLGLKTVTAFFLPGDSQMILSHALLVLERYVNRGGAFPPDTRLQGEGRRRLRYPSPPWP